MVLSITNVTKDGVCNIDVICQTARMSVAFGFFFFFFFPFFFFVCLFFIACLTAQQDVMFHSKECSDPNAYLYRGTKTLSILGILNEIHFHTGYNTHRYFSVAPVFVKLRTSF